MIPAGRSCLSCAVRETGCFCSLPTEALETLQSLGRNLCLGKGERLQREGESSQMVYVLCSGRIKLTASSAEGRLLIVRIAVAGDVVGLASLLSGTEQEVTAETLEPCEVKAIRREDFIAFMDSNQQVTRNTAVTMAGEYENAIISARRLALSDSAAERLASVLLEWSNSVKASEAGVVEFSMPLTHEELGNMAGISRETVTRLLQRFRGEGLVEQEHGTIRLPNPTRLRSQYASG